MSTLNAAQAEAVGELVGDLPSDGSVPVKTTMALKGLASAFKKGYRFSETPVSHVTRFIILRCALMALWCSSLSSPVYCVVFVQNTMDDNMDL